MLLCEGCGSGSTEREAASLAPGGLGTGGTGTNGDLGDGLTGDGDPVDPSLDPFETADWDIVSFSDPRTDTDPYDIIDGRVLIAFKNPPTLPQVDPNYFDVERLDTDPVYNQVVYNYTVTTTAEGQTMLNDPAIAAFITAEDLDVYSEWPMVAGLAAVLPEGQTVADAVANWPAEYPDLIEAVDPDMVAHGCTPPQDPPNDQFYLQSSSWFLWSDHVVAGSTYPVSAYSTDVGSLWHRGITCSGDSVLAIIDTGVDYSPIDLSLSSVPYGVNAGDNKATTQFLPRSQGGGEPWEWMMERSQANATAAGHGTAVAGVAAAYVNNNTSGNVTTYCASMMWGGKYVPLAVKCKGNVYGGPMYSLSGLYNAIAAIGAMKRLPGYLPSLQFSNRYVPYFKIETCNISIQVPGTGTALGNGLVNYVGDYVLLVASAGNENSSSRIYWPAYNSKVMTVAGHNVSGNRAVFDVGASNYQSYVDISAPADNLATYDMIGYTSNGYFKGLFRDNESLYWFGEGTSLASPIVAAAANLVSDHHSTWSPAIIRWWIIQNKAIDLPDQSVNQFGRLDTGALF